MIITYPQRIVQRAAFGRKDFSHYAQEQKNSKQEKIDLWRNIPL